MNGRIASIACALALLSVAPALALKVTPPNTQDAFGVAEQGDVSSTPSSTWMMSDPAGRLGRFAPGYMLNGVTTSPSSFGGINWPGPGLTLTAGNSGQSAPAFCSVSFEVPAGDLPHTNPLNPNLTIVVQDTQGDYFYAGKNQGVVPTFFRSQGGYDIFILKALNAQFSGGPIVNVVNRIAVVWSGWNDTLPPILSMYVTRPLINSQNNASKYVNNAPAAARYNQTEENSFNFQ